MRTNPTIFVRLTDGNESRVIRWDPIDRVPVGPALTETEVPGMPIEVLYPGFSSPRGEPNRFVAGRMTGTTATETAVLPNRLGRNGTCLTPRQLFDFWCRKGGMGEPPIGIPRDAAEPWSEWWWSFSDSRHAYLSRNRERFTRSCKLVRWLSGFGEPCSTEHFGENRFWWLETDGVLFAFVDEQGRAVRIAYRPHESEMVFRHFGVAADDPFRKTFTRTRRFRSSGRLGADELTVTVKPAVNKRPVVTITAFYSPILVSADPLALAIAREELAREDGSVHPLLDWFEEQGMIGGTG